MILNWNETDHAIHKLLFFISLSSEFCIERTRLALEELVTCSVCCPNRYICNKCVLSLHDNSWLQFIPLSWGICQTFESLADSVPWMMNHSGCPCPVQRQRCWHTCLFSEKSRFLWDTKSYYLSASFSLVTEMIQHPFDIRFGFKGQQILLLRFAAPGLENWCKNETKEHFCMCVVASAGCSALSRRTRAEGMCKCTHLGMPPLVVFFLFSPLSEKKRAWPVIRYPNCLHMAGLELENGVNIQLSRTGKLPASYSTCDPNCLST